MQIMRQDVNADVTNQVTSNVAAEVAQRMSDIVAIKLNDKFIGELHVPEEHQKKKRMMENRARDNSLVKATLRGIRREGASQRKMGQMTRHSLHQILSCRFFYDTCYLMTLYVDDCTLICSKLFCDGLILTYIIGTCVWITYLWIIR